ncbi:MAG: hypothetical protein H8K08_05770 [Nitrospira sp.]|nr:hypothetical protein [Nitrospira sp.]
MSNRPVLLRLFKRACLVLILGMSGSVSAGILGFGGDSWEEEVLLHDGSKIIVDRTVKRGGRHEVGQKPPYKEQSLSFTLPGTNQGITWEDHYSQDLGQANFLPMALDISEGTPYLVLYPMGCLSYNKWGRPNPPYVIFKFHSKEWKRIPLQELPADIKSPNLIVSSPDIQVKKLGTRSVSAEKIKKVIDGYKQPEFKTIQREAVKPGSLGSTNCEERVLYKGRWILPNDPIAQKFIDKQGK